MISQQRSGIPSTQVVQASSDGVCVRLASWSSSLHIESKSAVRIYWTQVDFDNDKNGIDLSGDNNDSVLDLNANAANIWLRSDGQAEVSVTSVGIG